MPSLSAPLALWSFSSVAGIRPPNAPAASQSPAAFPPASSPGFQHLVIKPNIGLGGMTWADANITTPRGAVRVFWSLAPLLQLYAAVPPGASATVHIPVTAGQDVTESGVPAASAPGVTFRMRTADRAIFDIISGAYAFAVVGNGTLSFA
jgi:hypothetical protein